MKVIIATILFVSRVFYGCCLDASLTIVEYDPPTFNLTFDETIPRPSFQILLNNNNLSYVFLTTSKLSRYFVFQITSETQQLISQLQLYTLRFHQPLNMKGSSSLNLDQFILRPIKNNPVEADISWLAVIVVASTFFFSMTDVLGLWMISFVQVYTLMMETSVFVSDFETQIAKDFYMVYPLLHAKGPNPTTEELIVSMTVPISIILLAFIIGIVSRVLFKQPQGFLLNKLKDFMTYRLVITCSYIFLLNLIINSVGFIKHADLFQGFQFIAGTVLCFIGFYVIFIALYAGFIVLNPRIKQDKESFRKYQLSRHYSMFSKLHNDLIVQKWVCRNFHLADTIKRLIIGIVCGFFHDFFYVTLTLQVAHLFYIFTARPYKSRIYNNLGIVVQSMVTIFYFYMFQTTLYFQMTPEILTHNDISTYQFVRAVFFGAIFFILVCGGIYEYANRIIVLKNQWSNFQSEQTDTVKKSNQYQRAQQESNRKKTESSSLSRFQERLNTPRLWQQKSILEKISSKKQ